MIHCRTITHMLINQEMVDVAPPSGPTHETARNFVICCQHGDWSGFLSWREAIDRLAPLNRQARQVAHPDGYYWIEER
jgi:hypothetical protein